MKSKRIVSFVLAIIIIASSLIIPPGAKPVEAGKIPSIVNSTNPNQYYFVALFTLDTWRDSGGYWNPAEPGGTYDHIDFPYSFDLPGRKIKSVTVSNFDNSFFDTSEKATKWGDVFTQSRYGSSNWTLFKNNSNSAQSPNLENITGKGTSTISFKLNLDNITLNASKPDDITNDGAASGVQGLRYYFPMLLTIDVDPQLVIKHYLEDGTSLASVFPSSSITMTNGMAYNPEPPVNSQYTYVGYKKSTTDDPPTGSISSGKPSFTYNNSFNTYTLNFYYRKISDEPDSDGTIHIKHFTTDGQSLDGVFGDHDDPLTNGSSYNPLHPTNPNYTYNGYKKSTTGSPPSLSPPYTGSGDLPTLSYTGSFTDMYLYYFYESTGGSNPSAGINGDFDVVDPIIDYHDSFSLNPKDITVTGCDYTYHTFTLVSSAGSYTSAKIYGKSNNLSYTQSTYPYNMTTGTISITMTVYTSCGTSKDVATHTLTVRTPTDNQPPQFEIGFVKPAAQTTPVYEVTEGTIMHLVYINDPTVPTPIDPDGDALTFSGFTLDGESDFIQSLSSKAFSGNGYHNIKMDTPGYHHVCGVMRDVWGAAATACTYIYVVPPNPIPVAVCPAPVIENHPVASNLFDSSQSYSPLGRSINHSRDEWTNIRSSYTNGFDSNMTYQISLHVYDSAGLKSLDPGTCQLIVKPDLPPVAKLQVPSVGIRNVSVDIFNKSYSPDGDTIVAAAYKYKYDAANNGFADDAWQTTSGSLLKFDFYPSKVGKYLFYTKVTEEYGKSGDTSSTAESTITLDVVNNAPEVSFQLEGNNPQPDLDPYTTVPASTMLGWPVYETNGTKQVLDKNSLWKVANGSLVGGEGRNFGPVQQFITHTQAVSSTAQSTLFINPFQNNGYGANRLSPWRSAANYEEDLSYPLINEATGKYMIFDDSTKMRSTKKLFLFTNLGTLYALNPKKISPVYNEMISYVPPYPQSKLHYTGGSPYAYKLADVKDYELVNGYLFVIFKSDIYTIHVYDVTTGQKIKSLYTSSQQYIVYNFIASMGDYVYAEVNDLTANGVSTIFKINTNLEVKAKLHLDTPAPTVSNDVSTYQYRFMSPFYFDQYGNFYLYEGYEKGTGYASLDVNVTKYNANLGKVWRRYLASSRGQVTQWNKGLQSAGLGMNDQETLLFVDSINHELYTQTYIFSQSVFGYEKQINVLDSNSGATKNVFYRDIGAAFSGFEMTNENSKTRTAPLKTQYYLDFDGTKHLGNNATVTADGNNTSFIGVCNTGVVKEASYDLLSRSSVDGGYNTVYNSNGVAVGQAGAPTGYDCTKVNQSFGEYFGDGFYVSVSNKNDAYVDQYRYMSISVGTPTTTPLVVKGFTNGQFYSSSTIDNADVRFTYNMQDVAYWPNTSTAAGQCWQAAPIRCRTKRIMRYA